MCGLAGIILGQKKRSPKELEQISETFTRLLLLSEHRGPHATGAAWVKVGGIDLIALCHDLRQLEGRMSAVLVARTDPQKIILLKGNMPLEERWHRRLQVWAYASEAAILTRALAGKEGWETVPIPENHALVISTLSDIPLILTPFTFQ